MKKMTNTQDGSESVGGWRNGEKNGWGQLTSNRYVKYLLYNYKNENKTFCLILIRGDRSIWDSFNEYMKASVGKKKRKGTLHPSPPLTLDLAKLCTGERGREWYSLPLPCFNDTFTDVF